MSLGALFSPARLLAAGVVVPLGAVALALVTQHVFGMQPCPWCVLQRLIFVAISLAALIGLALQLGATYVARGFSGDKAQLVPLIKGAMRHGGAAFIDVISPCVAFNNHPGSTRSYDQVREHNEAVNRIDFIDLAPEVTAAPAPGDVLELPQPDGSLMRLRKLHEAYDPTDRIAALSQMLAMQALGEIATGLLYVEPQAVDLHAALQTVATPLNRLGEAELCPGAQTLAQINAALR